MIQKASDLVGRYNADDPTVADRIEGQPSKRYWFMNIDGRIAPLEKFDDLEQAILYAGGQRADLQFVIREYGRDIVWPPSLVSG